jgi:hypothetical protein
MKLYTPERLAEFTKQCICDFIEHHPGTHNHTWAIVLPDRGHRHQAVLQISCNTHNPKLMGRLTRNYPL